MGFVNVGCYVGLSRPKTKKAMRDAIASDPGTVHFDRTSIFDTGDMIRLDEFPKGATLTVVGPDPFNDRRWYATISQKPDGTVLVK